MIALRRPNAAARKTASLLTACLAALALAGEAAAGTDPAPHGYTDLTGMAGSVGSLHAATSSSLYGSTVLNTIANDIVGTTDMVVAVEDDPVEWATFTGPSSASVLGFVYFAAPPSPLYHAIILGPYTYPVFGAWLSTQSAVGMEFPFAVSAMTLIHESFHWRMLSGDESAVNACALKYFPYYLARDFGVPETITQTTTQSVPVTTTTKIRTTKIKVVKKRVKVKGKWVTKSKKVPVTTYTTRTTTTYADQPVTTSVPNPLYATLVAASISFYTQQPPPYNSGTCPI